MDFLGAGIQDPRMPWNSANSSTGAQAIGWYLEGGHPVIDYVPSTLSIVSIAAAQAPTAGVALTLVSSTALGITVTATPTFVMPSLLTIPSGSLAIDGVPTYLRFGQQNYTVFYNPGTCVGRNVQVHSAGDDHLGTISIVGWDVYGYPMHETITLGNAATVQGKKAFKFIASATPAGTLSGSNIGVGQGDVYGCPIVLNAVTGLSGFWNNLIITGAGTAVAADTTSPATATTGDVRGTYLTGSASDGTKRLQLVMHPSLGAVSAANALVTGLVGVTQF
jgi:hypothetical protein